MSIKYYKRILSLFFSICGYYAFGWDTPVILEPANGVNTWNVVYFDWETVVASDFYELQLDTASGFSSSVLFDTVINYVDSSGNGDTWAYIDDLYFGTSYYWRLRAYGSGSYSSWSAVRSFITSDIVELSSPAQNSQNFTRVKIDWNSHPGVFFYDYQLDTTPGFNPPLITGIDTAFSEYNNFFDTEAEITNLFFGKTYYWRVRARNNVDYSQWATSGFSTFDQVVLANPPQNSTEFTGLTIDWLAFDGITLYQYGIDTSAGFNSPAYITGVDTFILFADGNTDTEAFVDNLYFGSNYFWHVRAINLNDTSSWSETGTFNTIGDVQLDLPHDSTFTYTAMEINWLAHAGADFYDYQLDTTPGFNSPALVPGYTVYINASDDNDDTKQYVEDLYFGKTYFWRVRARNAVDTSEWSAIRYFYTNDDVILTYPGYQETACTGLSFTWEDQPGISSYTLQLDTNATFSTPALVQVNSITSAQYYIQNLYFGKAYHWRAKAINNNDISSWSSPSVFYTWDQIGLLSPDDGALNQSTSGVTLDWLSHTGAMMYALEMDTTNLFNSPGLVQQFFQYLNSNPNNPDTKFDTGPLEVNTIYFWRVKIVNQVDESKWEERWFSTGSVPLTLPGTPVLIQPLLGQIDVPVDAALIWSVVPFTAGYFYQISTNPDFDNAITDYTTGSLVQPGFAFHTLYYWRVRSYDGTLASNWSLVYHFITELEQLLPPVLISPTNLSIDILINGTLLDWENVLNVNYYVVEYSPFENFMFDLTTEVTYVSQLEVYGLDIYTTYYWRVMAVNDTMINSNWSVVWSFTTENDLNVPVLVSPADNSINLPVTNVLLDWNDVGLADGYQLQYATDFDFTSNLIVENTVISNFLLDQLDYFETYYWRVKAVADTIIASGWSQAWSFTTMMDTNSVAETAGMTFSIYPNPTRGLVYVKLINSTDIVQSIDIYDIYGHIIFSYKPTGRRIEIIDLSSFCNGLYFLKITSGSAQFNSKVLLEK